MMSSEIFNLLHFLGQKLRCNNGWFGGIQLIFSGDFFNYLLSDILILRKVNNFVSSQKIWNLVFPLQDQIKLNEIFRQKDSKFIKILEEIKYGNISEDSKLTLKKRLGIKSSDYEKTQPIILLPNRRIVNAINKSKLNKLNSNTMISKIEKIHIKDNINDFKKLIEVKM